MKWMEVNDSTGTGPWAAEIGCGKLSGTFAQNATLAVHCKQFSQLLLLVASPYSTTGLKSRRPMLARPPALFCHQAPTL